MLQISKRKTLDPANIASKTYTREHSHLPVVDSAVDDADAVPLIEVVFRFPTCALALNARVVFD